MSRPALDPVARRAVEWMAVLQSGAVSADERAGFENWRAADPRHAAAWQRIESVQQVIRDPLARGLSPAQVRALVPPPPSPGRRAALGAALGIGALGVSLFVADRLVPLDGLTADLSTRTGMRRSVMLDDGSRLVLNARSAVDLRHDDMQNVVRLRDGLVHLATTVPASQELELASAFGSVWLREGSCNLFVDERARLCRLDVTDGSTRWTQGGTTLLLDAGDSLMLQGGALRRFTTARSAALAWLDGRLVVHDEPLSEVVRMLRPYWIGVLRLDARVADLRVTGTFPLAETWQALRSLAGTLPIRVDRRAGYWFDIGDAS